MVVFNTNVLMTAKTNMEMTMNKTPAPNDTELRNFVAAQVMAYHVIKNGHPDGTASDPDQAIENIMRLIAQAEVRLLEKPNELLRSAYQIALREGSETNWQAFTKQLKAELDREHQIISGLRAGRREGDK